MGWNDPAAECGLVAPDTHTPALCLDRAPLLQVTLKASQGGITEANISVSIDPDSPGVVCATGVTIDETSSPVAVTCLGFGRYLTVSTNLSLNLCRRVAARCPANVRMCPTTCLSSRPPVRPPFCRHPSRFWFGCCSVAVYPNISDGAPYLQYSTSVAVGDPIVGYNTEVSVFGID